VLVSASKPRNVIAWGNARGDIREFLEALKARNPIADQTGIALAISFRAFSAKTFQLILPGPSAEAITFRAFATESQSCHTSRYLKFQRWLGYPSQSLFIFVR
jgi:hypothetical protein